MNGDVGFILKQGLLDAFGEQADLPGAVNGPHIGVTAADQGDQFSGNTLFQEALGNEFRLPKSERAVPSSDAEGIHVSYLSGKMRCLRRARSGSAVRKLV